MSTKIAPQNNALDRSIEEIFSLLSSMVQGFRKTYGEIDSTLIPVVWTHESVCLEASKYTTLKQFYEGSSGNGAYRYARSNKLMKECASHMTGGQSVKVMNKARSSKARPISVDLGSYFPQIVKPERVHDETVMASGSMSRDVCINQAKEFDDMVEWAAVDPTSFATAEQNGWMSSCVKHMTPEAKKVKYLAMAMPAIIRAADNLIQGSNRYLFGITKEDLEAEGILTALEVIPKYKKDQATFLGFALTRIKGSMSDYIRANSPVPRSQMDKLKERRLQEEPESEGIGFQIDAPEATQAGGKVDSAKIRSGKEAALSCALGALNPVYLDATTGTDGQTMAHEIVGMDGIEWSNQPDTLSLKLLIDKMVSVGRSGFESNLSDRGITERESCILSMLLGGYDTKDIAVRESLSESRVSQIINQVVLKMRQFVATDESFVA